MAGTTPARPAASAESTAGLDRLGIGAGLGLAGGLAGLVLPIAFLWLAARNPGGFFTFGPMLIQVTGLLVLAGALLYVLSLLLYRRAFAHLRRADRGFTVPSALCLVGTLGFLLLIVAAILLFTGSSALLGCLNGQPSRALSCLRSSDPIGAGAGLLGFLFGWVGGLGIVLGVGRVGRRYREPSVAGGAVLYALLLLVLVGPFVFVLRSFPYVELLLGVIPVLTVLAPGLVLGGVRRIPRASG